MSTQRYYELHQGQPHSFIIATEGDHWEGDPDAKRITAAEGKRKLADEARRRLLAIPGAMWREDWARACARAREINALPSLLRRLWGLS